MTTASEKSPLLPQRRSNPSRVNPSSLSVQEGEKDGVGKNEEHEAVPVVEAAETLSSPNSSKQRIVEDAWDTFQLALPIFISRVSYVGMKTTDTALLGHVSGEALSAAALSDLWTGCTGVFINGKILGVLVGQAIGAKNHRLALVYLHISYIVLGLVSIFVIVAWSLTEQVWIALGQSPEISKDAGYFSFILLFSIPAQLGFNQLAQFFSAQRIMKPEVVVSLVALTCNLLLGLWLVLGIPFPGFDGFGFQACPIVTTVVVWCQCLFLGGFFVYFMKKNDTWNSEYSGGQWLSSWTKDITMTRIRTFSELYFPTALAFSSDYWRMGVIGTIAATLGEKEVGLFNASYRVLWITITFVVSLSGAAGIKMGLHLGNGDANGAKQAGMVGIFMALTFLIFLSVAVYTNIRAFGLVFTDDESYLDLFEECRLPFTCTLFFMNLSVGIETIPLSMGRTSAVFYSGFAASWLGQVPAVFLLTYFWKNDLYALYTGVAIGYGGLVLIYALLVYNSDWQKYADIARNRAEVGNKA